jgi:ribonuclease P protein component
LPAGFPRERRLRRRRDFLAVQTQGRKLGGRHFLVMAAPGEGRLGITVSKKVGNAVTRNRVKRLVREFVRRSAPDEGWSSSELDVVVIARPSAAGASFADAVLDLERLGARL